MSKYLKFSLIVLLGLLIAFRLALPYALIQYAEHRINKIPEYRVKIRDLDVHLYRGSYTIKDIALYKVNKNIPVPFFSAKAIDLSLQWKALLHGMFVGKIKAYQPRINFVMDPNEKNEQLSIDNEWQKAVKALFPLNFNHVDVQDGTLALRSFTGNPPFNLYLKNINFDIENMQNALRSKQTLASKFSGTGKTIDGARVMIKGRFDPFSSQPTFLLNGSIEAMQINKANAFLKHFSAIDVKDGNFSLFVEAAATKGLVKGYAKPIVKNLQIIDPEKDMGPVETLYKGALELVAKIVTNPKKQTIATKIMIEGQIDDPDTSVLSIIGYTLRHAFIQALLPQIDHTIAMRDIRIGKSST
ncbi:MAG: DUF748 domain-containing protein [Gammaproteobacteria bacterium]|nr:DUF748 domain-containing protein [Gammaproteobacteria bacterium]